MKKVFAFLPWSQEKPEGDRIKQHLYAIKATWSGQNSESQFASF